ncbi:hypothetical protein OGATHE_003441 [Ogataea polymorpha]|uniref:Uncharacterized protein n=1 Tax=Ogataea polymorpha TaxID=460523 RepID=A0A9P8T497_9ASCO|nr:hypothetical protein OGATHE_003441 [Ogataea polymorpha]
MLAPMITTFWSNRISRYLPNLDELSFLVVLALPKASMMGFVAKICFSVSDMSWLLWSESTDAKYRMMYLADTVFPAPDSPETTIDWF